VIDNVQMKTVFISTSQTNGNHLSLSHLFAISMFRRHSASQVSHNPGNDRQDCVKCKHLATRRIPAFMNGSMCMELLEGYQMNVKGYQK
jgi:hypothetical protein